jgi:YVTN family beta-propeller protein
LTSSAFFKYNTLIEALDSYELILESDSNMDSNLLTVETTTTETKTGVAKKVAAKYETRFYVLGKGCVFVIDAETYQVIAVIELSIRKGEWYSKLVLSPDRTKLYVLKFAFSHVDDSCCIYIISTDTFEVTATIPVGRHSYNLVMNSTGTRLYVRHEDNISVICTDTYQVVSIDVGRYPYDLILNFAGTRLYVVSAGSGSVYVIDTDTNRVIEIIVLEGWLTNLSLSPDETRLYVVDGAGMEKNIFVIDIITYRVIGIIDGCESPKTFAFNSAGTRLFVGNCSEGDYENPISIIVDTITLQVIATFLKDCFIESLIMNLPHLR